MSSPLLDRPGAVALDLAGGGTVAAHYGEPLPEQRRLAEGAGLVDRSDRDVVVVPGADRLSWLHSLTSQHLERLGDATGSEALVLSPTGTSSTTSSSPSWPAPRGGTSSRARVPRWSSSCSGCGSCSGSTRPW